MRAKHSEAADVETRVGHHRHWGGSFAPIGSTAMYVAVLGVVLGKCRVCFDHLWVRFGPFG